MWRAFYQAFKDFWNPTPELRAAMALPFRERIELLWQRSYWRASFRWPVIWRRAVVLWVVGLVIKIMLYAVIGFQTVALEREAQARAIHTPTPPRWDDLKPVPPNEWTVVGQQKTASPTERVDPDR
jgi:hypothetical protein